MATAVGGAAPVVWSFFGTPFPAGSMVVGLATCLIVRMFITLDQPGPKRWVLEGLATGLALLATAVWIMEKQVDLFAALGTGGGCGAVGAGIIVFFKRRGASAIDALEGLAGGAKPPAPMIEALKKIDINDGGKG